LKLTHFWVRDWQQQVWNDHFFSSQSLFSLSYENRLKIQIFLIKKSKTKNKLCACLVWMQTLMGAQKKGEEEEETKWRNYFAVPLLSSILFF